MNNSNKDNSYLFNLIWKNKYLKNLIFKYLKIFNIFYCNRVFKDLDQLLNFKNKEYLKEIFVYDFKYQLNQSILSSLPNSIDSITSQIISINSLKSIPNHIKKLNLFINVFSNDDFSMLLNNSNLETLSINCSLKKKINFSNSSITDLNLLDCRYIIDKTSLPTNLKYLKINYVYEEEIKSLPESLELLEIANKRNSLSSDFLPSNLKSLNYLDGIYGLQSNYRLPESLTNLTLNFDISFKDYLVLPKSLLYLNLSIPILKNLILPDSIEKLQLSFNNSIEENNNNIVLPKNLKELSINCLSLLNSKNGCSILPNQLEKLVISGYFYENQNENETSFNQKLVPNLFPKSLKYLSFDDGYSAMNSFNNGGFPLEDSEDLFPKSLTYLDFGRLFNQKIGLNVLKNHSNLKTLVFGYHYNFEILGNSIPQNLELLKINNPNYSIPIKLINNGNTLIQCFNYYNLNLNIKKYILQSGNNQILPQEFQNASCQTEYLDLNTYNNDLINTQFPTIKTLVVNSQFNKILDLSCFKNLEILILNGYPCPTIKSTIDENNSYNFYNLKLIKVNSKNTRFLNNINEIYYSIIKLY